MWKTYIADKFPWLVAGALLLAGAWVGLDGHQWIAIVLIFNGIGAIGFAAHTDLDKGYVDAIYRHKLERRSKTTTTQP